MVRKIIKVQPNYPAIICTFGTLEVYEYDLSVVLKSEGSMAKPLRDLLFFKKVFLESGTPTWPNGMDVCPDEIFLHGKKLTCPIAS